ncbi:MAG: amidohydrolase family protein [Verrucomicrobia bacterium]|nr:amidohydrolase family protein [Verrucomicrobiota bacterium]MBU1736365.1 amidohydrolase family protein [Verrucomicrobiota bacterium]MBU1858142.1 amidohydrolase family protein [Verrucomicrobiota bacterium]
MIIDMHTHYHNYEHLGEGVRLTFEEFIHELDFHGIDKAVVSNAFGLESDFVSGNRLLFEFMERYPDRIIGFLALHPCFPEESRALLREGVARGIKGVKLHCELSFVPYDDPRHLALVEEVASCNLPVTIHTGSSYIQPSVTLAKTFPNTCFLFGHTGGLAYHPMVQAIKKMDNVIADLAGNVFLDGFIETIVNTLGEDRVVYASDFVFMDPVIMLSMVRTARISDAGKEKILSGNAQRILKL